MNQSELLKIAARGDQILKLINQFSTRTFPAGSNASIYQAATRQAAQNPGVLRSIVSSRPPAGDPLMPILQRAEAYRARDLRTLMHDPNSKNVAPIISPNLSSTARMSKIFTRPRDRKLWADFLRYQRKFL